MPVPEMETRKGGVSVELMISKLSANEVVQYRFKRETPPVPPAPPAGPTNEEKLLMDIPDTLKSRH